MIEAFEPWCVAARLADECRAAVRAGVEEGTHRAGPVTVEDQVATADAAYEKIIGLGDFGGVTEIEPTFGEDRVTLGRVDGWIDERPSCDPKRSLLPIFDDPLALRRRVGRCCEHQCVHLTPIS